MEILEDCIPIWISSFIHFLEQGSGSARHDWLWRNWLEGINKEGMSLGLALTSSSLSLVSSMMTHHVCHRRCHLWNRKVIVMDAEEAKAEGIYTIEVLLTKTLVGWCWATHIIGKHSALWVWHFQGSELQKTRTCWYCQALLHCV